MSEKLFGHANVTCGKILCHFCEYFYFCKNKPLYYRLAHWPQFKKIRRKSAKNEENLNWELF